MITIYRKRSFFELTDNDAIMVCFLFGYNVFVSDTHIIMHISKKQMDNIKEYFDEKKISHQIISDDYQVNLFSYKNNNYSILLQKTQKEFPSAYLLKDSLNNLKNLIEEMNSFEPKNKEVSFYSDINTLLDNDKKLNFESIINDYRLKNPIDYSHKAFQKKPEQPKQFVDKTKVIRPGSKVTIQQEDSSMTEKYIIVNEPISYNDSGYLSALGGLGQMLLGKSEWDFFEYKNKSFQILEVDNQGVLWKNF